jgi:uncharacterized protein DUF4190/putative regulator of septum formation
MSIEDSRAATEPSGPTVTPSGLAGAPQRRSTSGLAIATLVLGITGFLVVTIPLNLIFGAVALVRTGRRGDKGRGLAIAGITLSVLWAAALGLIVTKVATSPEPKRDAQGRISESSQTGVDKLKAGDCVAQIKGEEVSDVVAQPCTQPGVSKVFAVFKLPQGPWPGEAAVGSKAGDDCTKRYERSGQQTQKKSEIHILTPTEVRWKLGDRQVVCLVMPAS